MVDRMRIQVMTRKTDIGPLIDDIWTAQEASKVVDVIFFLLGYSL